jgi:hypothetical protein
MKRQVLAFEQVEGRSLEARRLYNLHVMGLIKGGAKLGEGLEKCVYDSNRHMECIKQNLPPLGPNEVNVVLSTKAYTEEKAAKQTILKFLDPEVVARVFVTLQDTPTCKHVKLPKGCTSEARKSWKNVLVRAEKGSTNKVFQSKEEFGRAVINLVFGLWALHAHGLIHGDVKIEPGANNAVRIGPLYKLIDLGMVMTFKHVRRGIEDKTSAEAQELWAMRKYVYWPVGHLYAVFHKEDVFKMCKAYNIEWERVLKIYFENIDLMGLMRSFTMLVHLNPTLGLKPLLQSLRATPEDFVNEAEVQARKIVWASANSLLKSKTIDLGDRPVKYSQEMFLPLPIMYQRIRTFCNLLDLPDTIDQYLA